MGSFSSQIFTDTALFLSKNDLETLQLISGSWHHFMVSSSVKLPLRSLAIMVIRLSDDQEEKDEDLEGYFHLYDNLTNIGFSIDPLRVMAGELTDREASFIKSLKNAVIEVCTISLISSETILFLEKLNEIVGRAIKIKLMDGFDVNLLKYGIFGMILKLGDREILLEKFFHVSELALNFRSIPKMQEVEYLLKNPQLFDAVSNVKNVKILIEMLSSFGYATTSVIYNFILTERLKDAGKFRLVLEGRIQISKEIVEKIIEVRKK